MYSNANIVFIYHVASVWIAEGLGVEPLPNCFLNPPNTLSNYVQGGQLYTVYIRFASQFCSVFDRQKVLLPANFSQFKHCLLPSTFKCHKIFSELCCFEWFEYVSFAYPFPYCRCSWMCGVRRSVTLEKTCLWVERCKCKGAYRAT